MHLSWQVISAAVAGGLVTGAVLYGFARLQRWRWRDLEREKPLADLQRRFRAWEAAGMLVLTAFIFASYRGLVALAAASTPAAALFHVGPATWHWAAVAFFAGNVLAIGPTHLLFRWWMGPEMYAEFRDYQRRKFGFDSRTWMLSFCAVFGTAVVLVTQRMLAWGVSFTGEAVVVQPFRGSPLRYGYDQVQEIMTTGSNTATTLVIVFADGSHWSSDRAPSRISVPVMDAIAETVSVHSGLPVVRNYVIPNRP